MSWFSRNFKNNFTFGLPKQTFTTKNKQPPPNNLTFEIAAWLLQKLINFFLEEKALWKPANLSSLPISFNISVCKIYCDEGRSLKVFFERMKRDSENTGS